MALNVAADPARHAGPGAGGISQREEGFESGGLGGAVAADARGGLGRGGRGHRGGAVPGLREASVG